MIHGLMVIFQTGSAIDLPKIGIMLLRKHFPGRKIEKFLYNPIKVTI